MTTRGGAGERPDRTRREGERHEDEDDRPDADRPHRTRRDDDRADAGAQPTIGREFYDSSDYFERPEAHHLVDHESPFQRYRVAKVLDLHTPGPTDRVVDLGCGWGTFDFALAGRVGEVVGVDFSERSIEICERRLAEHRGDDIEHHGDDVEHYGDDAGHRLHNVRFLCADARDTGLEGGAWDVVLAADLFEHLYPEDSARVAREAYRLLRPGGRFVTWTPHRGHILEVLKSHDIIFERDISHVDYKSMSDMRRLLTDAGFTIEKAYYAESHVPVLRAVERLLQRFVPLLRRRIAVLGRKPEGQAVGEGKKERTGSQGLERVARGQRDA